MIAMSSHAPHGLDADAARRQIRARQSWAPFFKTVYYFGDHEPSLAVGHTIFIPSENFPTIRQMAEFAASHPGYATILNADIVLGKKFGEVIRVMSREGIQAAHSKRYNIEKEQIDEGDNGGDIFILKDFLWKIAAKIVPPILRIGHQRWDAWMICFIRHYAEEVASFTQSKCVFHEPHTSNSMPFSPEIASAQVDLPHPQLLSETIIRI